MKTAAELKKVELTKNGKVGTLTKAADGKWDMAIDGIKAPASMHYTDEQVDRIIAQAQAEGTLIRAD